LLAEFSIIKTFLSYELWNKYSPLLVATDFPDECQFLYRVLDSFHQTNTEGQDLHLQDLANLFFSQNKKDKEFYEGVFDTLSSYEPNVETIKQLVMGLKRTRMCRELSLTAYDVGEGKKDFSEVQKLLEQMQDVPATEEEEDIFTTDDLDTLLNATYRTPGLRWRCHTFNRSLGSLRKGDFGFIFARPEVGKTTLLASEVTFMAPQGEGPVLWINNEEVSEKVKSRVVQAALGITQEQMLANSARWNSEYRQLIGSRILIPKHHVTRKEEIERLCKKWRPSLIIIDTIDNITGFKADREDLVLGAIYRWGRSLAAQYGPVIGVCHADSTAEGVRWLNMNHVVNAKTEKQKHADFIIGVGKVHDAGWDNVRFIGISKNKLTGDHGVTEEQHRHAKLEILIDAIHARYEDIT
jgi:replicative DNA helicase